ncbi:hypothetical protein EIP86_010387 [Pleurotus ostreatoroseus]|nr:hypothetical protein EIP86_010387 [Pleurotus ostreatoroseus]
MASSAADAAGREVTPPPSRPSESKLLETPYSSPRSQDSQFTSASLPERRGIICHDASSVTRKVPLIFFFKYALPPLHAKIDLDTVIEKLKSNRTILNDRLMMFSRKDPAQKSGTEAVIYAPLEKIIRRMVEAASSEDLQPTLEFFNKGNSTPISDNRDCSSKPDIIGALRPCKKTSRPKWVTNGVSGEVKPLETEEKAYDDASKVMGSMQHCLCDDVARRFTYGFTIENTTMKMWYASRGFVFVSVGFNFITDHVTTARFFLSLAFAQEHQLGFDPTILRTLTGEYDIKVFSGPSTSRMFRTVELIYDKSVDTMNGPGTRMWTVQELVDSNVGDTLYTLKESWVPEDRAREGDILHALSTARPWDVAHAATVDECFLHVLCHGDVQIEGQRDSTYMMLRNAPFPPESSRLPLVPPPREVQKGPRGCAETVAEQNWTALRGKTLPPITPLPAVRYRIVYTEVYTPLYKETKLDTIFWSLASACAGVQALHEGGFVHRNLSTETIVVDQLMMVRITGLQDAKRIDATCEARPERITALDFIAVEVRSRQYMFYDKPARKDSSFAVHGARDNLALVRQKMRAAQNAAQSASNTVPTLPSTAPETRMVKFHPFRYNILHDLESVWWVAVYFLLKRQAVIAGELIDTCPKLERVIDSLFGDRSERFIFLSQGQGCTQVYNLVHPTLRPVVDKLDEIREALINAYNEAEEDPTQKVQINVSCQLYTLMGNAFQAIAEYGASSGIVLQAREPSNTQATHDSDSDSEDAAPADDSTAVPPETDEPRLHSCSSQGSEAGAESGLPALSVLGSIDGVSRKRVLTDVKNLDVSSQSRKRQRDNDHVLEVGAKKKKIAVSW